MNQLRNFLYLDENALEDYVSAMEDGVRRRRETSANTQAEKSGGVDVKIVKGQASGGTQSGERTELDDSPPARFNRLVELATANEDAVDWLEIQSLDQLSGVGRGTLVHFECDAYIPSILKAFGGDDMDDAFKMLEALQPFATNFGLDMQGMPSGEDVAGLRAAKQSFTADLVFVGEEEDSDWKVAGKLQKAHLRDADIDDYVRVVGKVSRSWDSGTWKSLMALPGASLLSRAERRRLERQAPEEDDETSLQGPAVMLDVLAIYR